MPIGLTAAKLILEASIKAALNAASAGTLTVPQKRDQLATDLNNAINAFVKESVVTTTGTAAAQTGVLN